MTFFTVTLVFSVFCFLSVVWRGEMLVPKRNTHPPNQSINLTERQTNTAPHFVRKKLRQDGKDLEASAVEHTQQQGPRDPIALATNRDARAEHDLHVVYILSRPPANRGDC